MSYGFTIGGCRYRMQCRDRVAASIAALAYAAGKVNAPFLGMRVLHTSHLFRGRCQWLNAEIASLDVKWAISVDSDTAFNATHLISSLQYMTVDSVAIGCAPVRIGGTESVCNLNLLGSNDVEARLGPNDLANVLAGNREISSGGFGLAVFHLDWFRQHWPVTSAELASRVQVDGEDIEFCRAVRRRKGKVIALPIETEHFEFSDK